EGDDSVLSLEGWAERAPAGARLAALLGGTTEADSAASHHEWAADEELRVISLSTELAEHLGVDLAEIAGQPLTRALRLEENDAGEMPLISELAARRDLSGHKALSRTAARRTLVL